MNPRKPLALKTLIQASLFLAAAILLAVPAFSQRVTLDADVGQISDKFGGLSRNTATVGEINGQIVILKFADKEGDPNIVAGGDVRLPADTSAHASEVAIYGGPEFHFGSHFMAGVHAQIRKLWVPSSEINGTFFTRDKFALLELPAVFEIKSGGTKHVFLQGQIAAEFKPHLNSPSTGSNGLPSPNLDHGYSIRGSVGYATPRWYLKATYETRYFKFQPDLGNPNGLYNWRTDAVTGGVGIVF